MHELIRRVREYADSDDAHSLVALQIRAYSDSDLSDLFEARGVRNALAALDVIDGGVTCGCVCNTWQCGDAATVIETGVRVKVRDSMGHYIMVAGYQATRCGFFTRRVWSDTMHGFQVLIERLDERAIYHIPDDYTRGRERDFTVDVQPDTRAEGTSMWTYVVRASSSEEAGCIALAHFLTTEFRLDSYVGDIREGTPGKGAGYNWDDLRPSGSVIPLRKG